MPKSTSKLAGQATTPARRLTVSFYQSHSGGEQDTSQLAFPGSKLLPLGKKGTWASVEASVSVALAKEDTSDEDLFAIFPTSFASLTGLNQESLVKLLADNPSRDLYFFNLNPVDEAVFPNPWSRLFLDVKGMGPLMALVLKAVGEGETQANHLRAASEFHTFPAAIGTRAFWQGFFTYANQTINQVQSLADVNTKKLLRQTVESNSGQFSEENYRGLLCRHLFPFFLRQEGAKLKAMKLLVPLREQTLNVHARTLRQLREASVRSNAPWLGAAWLNYRNLYLLGVNGKPWCDKNLSLISPQVLL